MLAVELKRAGKHAERFHSRSDAQRALEVTDCADAQPRPLRELLLKPALNRKDRIRLARFSGGRDDIAQRPRITPVKEN
ncbi:hypothetical protein BH23CHL4_BH23CHL4_25910 [soil metagenome]